MLDRVGASMERVVKTTVYITNAEDFSAFNAAYAAHFPTNKPARIGVVAGMTIDASVEMDFIVYVGEGVQEPGV